MTRSRDRKAVRMSAALIAAAVTLAVAAWVVLGARSAETAPAAAPEAYEAAVSGPAGGYELDLAGNGMAAVYATRNPDGGVSVDCTDSETAAAMVYGARP